MPRPSRGRGTRPDARFRYINEQGKAHQTAADPVISLDTRKDPVGQFASAGQKWQPEEWATPPGTGHPASVQCDTSSIEPKR